MDISRERALHAVHSALLAAVLSSCGGDGSNENAFTCGEDYRLGCVGDGRAESKTTPGTLPNTSCGRDDYTYFRIDMGMGLPRDEISSCRLYVTDSSQSLIAEYVLPGGTYGSSGTAYGCSPGQTPAHLGWLSYSSCCATGETLTFELRAMSAADALLQVGSESGVCAPGSFEKTGEVEVAVYADTSW